MAGDTQVAELSQRMQRAEQDLGVNRKDINVLTQNVSALTKDVDRMVQSQEKTFELVKQQAIQQNEIKNVATELTRAFGRIEGAESEIHTVQLAIARREGRDGALSALLKHWPTVTALVAAGVAGGAFIKGLF